MRRPTEEEYAPFHTTYIRLVPEDDVLRALETQLGDTIDVLGSTSEEESLRRHPPYTWSVREALGHMTDTERIFAGRALRFARGDATPLPGFDENAYAAAAGSDRIALGDLLKEFEVVRRSSLWLFSNLEAGAWARAGEANGCRVTVRALAYMVVGHARHHTAILRKRLSGS